MQNPQQPLATPRMAMWIPDVHRPAGHTVTQHWNRPFGPPCPCRASHADLYSFPFSRTKSQHSMPFRTHQNTFQVLWKYQLPDHKYLQGSNPSNQTTRDQGFFPLKSPSNLPASVIYPWLYFVQGKCFWLSTLSLHHNFVHLHQVSLQSPLLQGDQSVQSSSELKFSLWEWSSSTKRLGI